METHSNPIFQESHSYLPRVRDHKYHFITEKPPTYNILNPYMDAEIVQEVRHRNGFITCRTVPSEALRAMFCMHCNSYRIWAIFSYSTHSLSASNQLISSKFQSDSGLFKDHQIGLGFWLAWQRQLMWWIGFRLNFKFNHSIGIIKKTASWFRSQ